MTMSFPAVLIHPAYHSMYISKNDPTAKDGNWAVSIFAHNGVCNFTHYHSSESNVPYTYKAALKEARRIRSNWHNTERRMKRQKGA